MKKLRKWWKRTKQSLILIGITVLLFIVFVILGYRFNWSWTGFPERTGPTSSQYQPAKTLWDWFQLLIIPAVLAVAGYIITFTTSRNEQQSTQLRDQTERDIALDNQREIALQQYIDKMSELLLDKKLRESQPDDEKRNVARVRTLTALPRLDNNRKRSIIQFLYESGLINEEKPIIVLSGADLSRADLSGADLSRADLSGAVLSRADLSGAKLIEANLSEANLVGADLSEANLVEANLSKANLVEANLSGADLVKADLSEANLVGVSLVRANLVEANLSKANFVKADLSKANLVKADLSKANLVGADLSKANLVGTDLSKATSLKGATLPDGTIYQEMP